MEYKINGYCHREDYYFNDEGQVYFYMPQSVNKGYLKFSKQVREVHSAQPGRPTHYLVANLYSVDGMADWIDVADTMARTAFKIPTNARGYVRHKNHDYTDLSLKNLEFIVQQTKHSRPYEIHDLNGKIPYNMCKEEKTSSIEKPSMTILPDKPSTPPVPKGQTDSIKLDLGDRDRSVVAELLYVLIEERGMSASEAFKALVIPLGYGTLELYLEGKNIIKERLAKEDTLNQERDKKEPSALDLVETNCEYNGAIVYLNKTNGKAYIKSNGKPKEL